MRGHSKRGKAFLGSSTGGLGVQECGVTADDMAVKQSVNYPWNLFKVRGLNLFWGWKKIHQVMTTTRTQTHTRARQKLLCVIPLLKNIRMHSMLLDRRCKMYLFPR